MKREILEWAFYWCGILFILACLVTAMCSCNTANAGNSTSCMKAPPACEYGTVPVCWCPKATDRCAWYCVSAGRVSSK